MLNLRHYVQIITKDQALWTKWFKLLIRTKQWTEILLANIYQHPRPKVVWFVGLHLNVLGKTGGKILYRISILWKSFRLWFTLCICCTLVWTMRHLEKCTQCLLYGEQRVFTPIFRSTILVYPLPSLLSATTSFEQLRFDEAGWAQHVCRLSWVQFIVRFMEDLVDCTQEKGLGGWITAVGSRKCRC